MTDRLIDNSALARLAASTDPDMWADRIDRGLVRISTVNRLEVGYSARSGRDLRVGGASTAARVDAFEYQTPATEDRAVEVQVLLADRGGHRAPSVPDLIIAAIAELTGLTILHVDKDLDLIAEITGQPTERLAVA